MADTSRQPPWPKKPGSAATSSRTTRRFPCGRATPCKRTLCLPEDAGRLAAESKGRASRSRESGVGVGSQDRESETVAWLVSPYPVLPQALPLLLLPGLYQQERAGRHDLSGRAGARMGSSTRRQPAIAGRPLDFVYFGGGTPSFLSTAQLTGLVERLTRDTAWNAAEEVTFECEPGTITDAKLAGVARTRCHAAEPRRGELRRPDPGDQRPRAPIAGDRPLLRRRAQRSVSRRSTST